MASKSLLYPGFLWTFVSSLRLYKRTDVRRCQIGMNLRIVIFSTVFSCLYSVTFKLTFMPGFILVDIIAGIHDICNF